MSEPIILTRRRLLAGLSALSLAGCAGESVPVLGLPSGHPQVGRLYDTQAGVEIGIERLGRRLAEAKFVLLGEKHDNADHHRLQARLISSMTDRERRPAVLFEMIDATRDAALADYMARPDRSAAGLGPALGWARSGWPDWAFYQPIAESAFAANLPLAAADFPRDQTRTLSRTPDAIEDGIRLMVSTQLPEALDRAQRAEIAAAHCGHMPDAALPAMARVQRVRDAHMAVRMTTWGANGAVLIAGNGHVRRDRGVPWHLVRLGADPRAILSVGLLEVPVDRSMVDPRALAGEYDVIWLTGRVDETDPCVVFAEQLKSMGRRT